MRFEVILPSLGDDEDAVSGGAISFWLAEMNALLEEGDDFVELTTDKAAFVVPCPRRGTLVEKRVQEGNRVSVGDVLGVLDVESE
jgi:pyruvate/2-oxoglutarate dehydrogenase complex dihydrolipoamide acyltransferase (E2) component